MRLLFVLISMLTSAQVLMAESINDNDFFKVESSFMRIIRRDSDLASEEMPVYPIWTRVATWDWLKYSPDASADASSVECNSKTWLEENRQPQAAPISLAIQNYAKKCDKEIQTSWKQSAISGYLTMMIKLDENNYPYGRFVMFNLPNGNRVKGFLALKGDGRPRPLIIFRLGIFANVDQFLPERFLFMQMFEQSPFNILVLESNSSKEYIFRNKNLSLGGFDEGIQDFLIAKKLQDPSNPMSHLIQDVHLMAMSFGGHGAFFASLLGEWDRQKTGKSVFSSLIGYCPLINFRDSLDFHVAEGVVPIGLNYWVSNRLHGIEKLLPGIDEKNFIESMLSWVDTNYKGPAALDETVPLNDFLKSNQKKFWAANDFWPYFKDVKTPILIFATKTDPIVPYQLNSQRLLNKYMNLGKTDVQVVEMQSGMHCNFPGSYQWRPMASLAQAFILRKSEYKSEKMSRLLDLSNEELQQIKQPGWKERWAVSAGKLDSEFQLKILISENPKLEKTINFSFQDIGFAESGYSQSQELLQHWFDQNLHTNLLENAGAAAKLSLSWYR